MILIYAHLLESLCSLNISVLMRKLCAPAGFTAPLWVYKIEIHAWILAVMTKMASKTDWNSAIHLKLRALMSPHQAMHEMKMASRERFMGNHISQSTSVRILGLFFIWRVLTMARRTKNCRMNCLRCGWGPKCGSLHSLWPCWAFTKPTEIHGTITVTWRVSLRPHWNRE